MNGAELFWIVVGIVIAVAIFGIREHTAPKCANCGIRIHDERHLLFCREEGIVPVCRPCFYHLLAEGRLTKEKGE